MYRVINGYDDKKDGERWDVHMQQGYRVPGTIIELIETRVFLVFAESFYRERRNNLFVILAADCKTFSRRIIEFPQ